MSNPFKIANDASKLSIPQLQQALQHGTVPPYIGIPLLQDMVQKSKQGQAMAGAQQKPPTIAEQVMAQAQQAEGVPSLETNLPATSYAGGGIVAFADGGMYEDDETDYEDYLDNANQQEMNDLMDEYAQTFQGGIGQLPAAQQMREEKQQDSRQGAESAPDFIARIMHKESRGQRYGKDGQLLRSEKGALGEMQVMPATSRDPGFGVKPARDNSPDELARVGHDYANTLLQRYGDPKLAAIAYNMGPGATDKWLASGADMSKLPRETQGYVKGFAGGGVVHFQNRGEVKDKYAGLWPYNAPEAGKFSYEDAAEYEDRKREEEEKSRPKGYPGITYTPTPAFGNVTPTRTIPKETNERESEMMRAVKTPFRAIGSGISSLYGGKAEMPSDTDYTASGDLAGAIMGERGSSVQAAPAVQNIPNISRGRPTMVNDPRLMGAQASSAQVTPSSTAPVSPVDIGFGVGNYGPSQDKPKADQTEAKADPYAEFRDLFKRREENLGKQREQDRYMALLSAGLGMMGGTSPNALANIGAGGQQGIQALMASNKDRTAEENALLSGRLGLAKIGANAENQRAMMDLRKELAISSDARQRQLAENALVEKHEARGIREEDKLRENLKDIKTSAEKYAESMIGKDTALLAATPEQKIAAHQAYVDSYLRRDKTFSDTYKKLYKKDYPWADAGTMPQQGSKNQGLFDKANAILNGK